MCLWLSVFKFLAFMQHWYPLCRRGDRTRLDGTIERLLVAARHLQPSSSRWALPRWGLYRWSFRSGVFGSLCVVAPAVLNHCMDCCMTWACVLFIKLGERLFRGINTNFYTLSMSARWLFIRWQLEFTILSPSVSDGHDTHKKFRVVFLKVVGRDGS